jgi:hypothetical protein
VEGRILSAYAADGVAPLTSVSVSGELPRLISLYADNLRIQAATLRALPGELGAENRAEAEAYLAVVDDLERILSGELSETGLLAD